MSATRYPQKCKSLPGYLRDNSLLAYRVTEGRVFPIEQVDSQTEARLDGLLVEPGLYRVGAKVFDLTSPGVYRFQSAGIPARQAVVLPNTIRGIASVAVELGALGNTDRNKPWLVMAEIATRRRLLMHCVQFSNLSVFLADRAGLAGRSWLMWNYAALDRGAPLSSHSICELSRQDMSETRLYDPSFGVEFVVEDGTTDFPTFQAALLSGAPVTAVPVSQAFGYEYGSRFLNPFTDDFDHDALAAWPELLIERHRALARGPYVIGKDLQNRSYTTHTSLHRLKSLSDEQIPEVKRTEMFAATPLGSRNVADEIADENSLYRLSDTVMGYRLTASGASPLTSPPESDPASSANPVSLGMADDSGLKFLTGTVWSVGDTHIDLRQDGLYRLRAPSGGAALQACVVTRRSDTLIRELLEAVAAGSLHDDLGPTDVQLAQRSVKAAVFGVTLEAQVISILNRVSAPYRLWRLPTVLSDDHCRGWPMPLHLSALEIPGETGPRLIDLHRGLELKSAGQQGFPAWEAATDRTAVSLCHTPRFAYGGHDGKTGLSADHMMPLWLGDIEFALSLWADSLAHFPALAKLAQGKAATTALSQEKAKSMLAEGHDLDDHLVAILDAPVIT